MLGNSLALKWLGLYPFTARATVSIPALRSHKMHVLSCFNRVQFCDPMDCSPPGSSVCGNSPGKNTEVGCHALLQGIFLTLGSNPGLPHWRLILYHLSHQGSPRILEWVAYHFSRGTSPPRNQTGVFCIAGRFFTSRATREPTLINCTPIQNKKSF